MSSRFYNEVIKPTISDIKVDLDEEFDKNFERKSYFNGSKWAPTKRPYSRGSLMVRSGALRRGMKSTSKSDGLTYTSDKPYARIHNEGGTIKFKSRKGSVKMPKRQFIGRGKNVDKIIREIADENIAAYFKKYNLLEKISKL
ncbi:MAG: phage virion morphogenesis protein [Rikenellaceae bacterium]